MNTYGDASPNLTSNELDLMYTIGVLKQAIEWYANEANYPTAIQHDRGQIARKAIINSRRVEGESVE